MMHHDVAAPRERPSTERMRRTLDGMLKHLQGAAAAPHPPPQSKNWRTRKIIQEIKAFSTTAALVPYEEELRGVLYSQECRLRGKIVTACLYDECNVEERVTVRREECVARTAIETELEQTLGVRIQQLALQVDEDVTRCKLRSDRKHTLHVYRRYHHLGILCVTEGQERGHILAVEELCLREMYQRRLMEVGHELQLEIHKQNSQYLFMWIHKCSNDFILKSATLCRAEEAARTSLEKFSLLFLTMRYSEAEGALSEVISDSVVAAAIQRSCRHHVWEEEVQFISRRTDLLLKEEALRHMVEGDEQERRQGLHAQFVLGWREVYKAIRGISDAAQLVMHLELYERRYITDQYRHSYNGISEAYDYENRIVRRNAEDMGRLFERYVASVEVLWRLESVAFNDLRRRNHFGVAEMRSLQAAQVLAIDEVRARRCLIAGEVRTQLRMKTAMLLEQCGIMATESARRITAAEIREWDELQLSHQKRIIGLPVQRLEQEEYEQRGTYEQMETNAAIDLFYLGQRLHNGFIIHDAASLSKHETSWRSSLMVLQSVELNDHLLSELYAREKSMRRTLVRHEAYFRYGLYRDVLCVVEEWNRHTLYRAEVDDRVKLQLRYMEHVEEIRRRYIEYSERSRREFIVGSVPYDSPFCRACEVDELSHRLDVMHDAELTIRAVAYRYGHDAAVQYGSAELRAQRAQLHFLSLHELLLDYMQQFVEATEPIARQRIEHACEGERIQVKAALEEERSRLEIASAEKSNWARLYELIQWTTGNQQEMEAAAAERQMASLLERGDVLGYLKTREAATRESAVRRNRAAIRDALHVFLEKLYWARDTILLEESVHRQTVWQRMVEGPSPLPPSGRFVFSVHSLALLCIAERAPAYVTMWHSDDPERIWSPLASFQTLRVAGKTMEVSQPDRPLRWSCGPDTLRGVLFFCIMDTDDCILATTSYLLKDEDPPGDGETIIVPLAEDTGRLNLVVDHV